MLKIKYNHLLQYFFEKIRIYISIWLERHLNRKPIDIYVVGAYHGLNIGDMSMGYSVQRAAHSLKLNIQLLQLGKKPFNSTKRNYKYILGGGAILSPKNLNSLMINTSNDSSRIAILGVDFHLNHSRSAIQYLSGASSLGSRISPKEEDKREFRQTLQRNDIVWHPDLTFSFYPLEKVLTNTRRETYGKKTIGLNVFPFFYRRSQCFWDFALYTDKIPYDPQASLSEFAQKKIAQQYVSLVRHIVKTYTDAGFSICHIPFALEDDLFAKSCLFGLPVKFHRFTNDPYRVFSDLQSLEGFIPTRLHAHIFSAISKIPFFSISYGIKCRNLLSVLRVPKSSSIDYASLLDNDDFSQGLELPQPPNFVCQDSHLLSLAASSKLAIEQALSRLSKVK